MKKLSCFAIAIVVLLSCDQKATSGTQNTREHQTSSPSFSHFFTLPDAEKIMGEPAHITDSSWTKEKDVVIYQSAYTANVADDKSGKTGTVYFFMEQHTTAAAAMKVYTDIKTANQNNGIKELEGLGDEAYFHSDNQNFYFIMVRKGNIGFRIKVNKITSATSLDEFNSVAKQIAAAI